MNSSYISTSIFNEKNSYYSIDDNTRLKNLRFSQAFKNSKEFTAKLGNLISTRDNLRKANLNPNHDFDDK